MLLYSATVALTIALASAVYVCVERPFLRLKSRFAIVPSNEDARPRHGVVRDVGDERRA